MMNKEIDLIELFKEVWSQKKRLIKWGIISAVIGIVVAISLPNQYKTFVKIAPEGTSKMKGSSSLGALAELSGIDMGSKSSTDGISAILYPEIIRSVPFILELANIEVNKDGEKMSFFDYITKEQKAPWWGYIVELPSTAMGFVRDMFSSSTEEEQNTGLSVFKPTNIQDNYVKVVRQSIMIDIDDKVGVITLAITMQNPLIAAVISDSVLSNLQKYMVNYRTAKNRNDLSVNERRLVDAKNKYYYADSVYASALDRNQGLTTQSSKVKIDRLYNERLLAFNIYQQLAAQVEMNRVKLQESTPIATVIEPASIPLRTSAPKRSMLVIAFTLLGVLAATVFVIFKQISKK